MFDEIVIFLPARTLVVTRRMPSLLGACPGCCLLLPALEEMCTPAVLRGAMNANCVEICIVGSESDSIHTLIDDQVEELGYTDVLTSMFDDQIEGCEYFLSLAGGGEARFLFAPILEHVGLSEILLKATGLGKNQ